MTTRLLFINSIDDTRRIETTYPPLGLGYLASALRDVFGHDYFEFRVVDRDVENTIKLFTPDIVAITAVSANFNYAAKYARIAKQYELPVIMGGIHISALPLLLTDNMDVAIIGEGERTIIDLLRIFKDESCLSPDSLQQVKGIAYKQNGRCVKTLPRSPINPLDQISMPARDILTFTQVSMLTSRGCPYRCVFCSSSCFWGSIRYFSPEYVVHELTHIFDNYQLSHQFIIIWDSLFIADIERLRNIVDLMERKGLLSTFRFWCQARANLINDEVAQLLKRMGVRIVSMGFESGSPSILQYYKGPTISIKDHEDAIITLKKQGIIPLGSFIIGAPKETRADFMQTLQFMKKHQLDADLNLLTPLPGTPLWDYAWQKGLVSNEMDWSILKTGRITTGDGSRSELENCWNNAVILSDTLTRREIFDLYNLFEKQRKQIQWKNNWEWALKHPLWSLHVYLGRFFTQFLHN